MYKFILEEVQISEVIIDMRTNPITTNFSVLKSGGENRYLEIKYTIICIAPQTYFHNDCQSYFQLNGCIQCTLQGCSLCGSGFKLVDNLCSCIIGTLVSGICTTLEGCNNPFVASDGSQSCLTCNTTQFHAIPVGGVCICLQGTLVNGVCNTIIGCISPYLDPTSGTVQCSFCNTSAHFQQLPMLDGLCYCKEHF